MNKNENKIMINIYERLSVVETQLNMIIDNTKVIPTMIEQIKTLQKDCDDNKDEHKTFWDTFVSKNAFKIVSVISMIFLIVITIIEIIRIL